MEGKNVILSVLIMSLVMAQIQVEAEKICCSNTRARNKFDSCTAQGIPVDFCLRFTDCITFPYNFCPPEFPANRLENSGASKIGDGAVEDCAKVCSTFCTNGRTKLAVETA